MAEEPTNKDRAGWAKEAVDHFSKVVGAQDEDLETKMTDLLADMMHLADQNGLDFEKLTEHAENHFDEEFEEEEGGEDEEDEEEEEEEEEEKEQP